MPEKRETHSKREEFKEGQQSAYAALSEIYLSMHRVNVQAGTYSTIKTTDAILKYSIPDSEDFNENMQSIIKGLAAKDSYDQALSFLDIQTLNERMKGKKHISTNFEGKVAGSCKLHYIKEDVDEEGNLLHAICAVEVTNEFKYQSIFEALSAGYTNVYLVDPLKGQAEIMKLNGYITSSFHRGEARIYPYEPVKNQYVSERVHPDDRAMLREALRLKNVEKAFETSNEYTGTYRIIDHGKVHYCQYRYMTLKDFYYIIAGFQNIDHIMEEHLAQEREKKRLEEKHKKAIEQQMAVINTLSKSFGNVFVANIKKRTARVIRLMKDYDVKAVIDVEGTEFPYDSVVKRWVHENVHPDDKERIEKAFSIENISQVFSKQDEYAGSYRSIECGKLHNYRFDLRKIDNEGNVVAGFQIVDEIIEEQRKQEEALAKALEAAEQANKAKSTFLSSMSHDIRTPMNAIVGFTALAKQHVREPEKVEEYLENISTSSSHLLNLINDILDMSRIESGTVKLEENPVHLGDIFHDLKTMIQGQVDARGLKLTVETEELTHQDVITDKLRLNQMLLNLVSNAIKFTPEGGSIQVAMREKGTHETDRAYYELTVEDNGLGMSKKFLSHVFDTFAREQSATVSGIQGTGLGMAITKNIVDMMGGKIRVESEEGKGSKFTVNLPMKLNKEAEEKENLPQESEDQTAEGKKEIPDYRGKRILLVEDNAINRELATLILEETGMEIDSVEDGDIAVATMHTAPADTYDLILMDIQMPKMDGYTATREIRTFRDNKKANIPIVAMTANAFEEDKQKAYESGMNGHIIKPISLESIASVLDEFL